MSRLFVTTQYAELLLTKEEAAYIPARLPFIYPVPRKENTYRCSLKYLPEVIFATRNQTVDTMPEGTAKCYTQEELTRRHMTAELRRCGADTQYRGLWAHQNLGVALAQYNKRFNFFYETRLGKTRMALQIIQNALEAKKIKRALVIVPSTIIPAWLDDAKDYPMKVAAYYGDEKQKAKAMTTPCHIMLWSTGLVAKNIDLLTRCHFDMVFLDESSKCKSRSTQLSKALLQYAQTVEYWYNLSATPAPNGEHEYYAQMQFVDKYLFNPVWSYFKARYFDNKSYSPKFEKLSIKPEKKAEFMRLVNSCSVYVDQQVIPMTATEWHTVEFPLSAQQHAYYEDMRKDLATAIGDTDVVVDSAVVARSKLQQICSGFVLDTDARLSNDINRKLGMEETACEVHKLPGRNARLDALARLLLELGDQQVVIWAHYTQEFVDIAQLLGDRCRVVRGGTLSTVKNEFVAKFKERQYQYLVAHPLSIGMGINLTVAHSCIYYRVTDSWEALKQSSERIKAHINIQPHKCDYYVLLAIAPDGAQLVDHLVYNNVSGKRDASTGFLQYLKGNV